MRREATTIVDIARMAGVSKSTVARALSGSGRISQATRERIEAAALEAGYRRNELARSLRRGRSGMVGLLIPDVANPFWADVARGAQDAAAARGCAALIVNSDRDEAQEARHIEMLLRSQVDGLLVCPASDGAAGILHFDRPIVMIGYFSDQLPQLASVRSDVVGGVALALDAIHAAGHREVGLLTGGHGRFRTRTFLDAVAAWCADRGVDVAAWPVEEGRFTSDGGEAATRSLLARPRRPTCLFAANDLMALGALRAFGAAGIDCPGEMSLVGFDGIAAGAFAGPGLSTIAKPSRRIGQRAMEMIIDEMEGVGAVAHEVLPCQLVLRGTLGPPG